jgi:hypothetical protein
VIGAEMADFKKQYARVTQQAKKAGATASKLSQNPAEERIFSTFRERAREDYKTMTPTKTGVTRG